MLPVEERVQLRRGGAGLHDEQAQAEAARCLACGVCSECLSCFYKCQANAINHDMVERWRRFRSVRSCWLPAIEAYHAEKSAEYGWGRFPNVVTSLQFERLLSASGPTFGHVRRPSDGERPQRIAFIQCVGSRDQTARLLLGGLLHVRHQRGHHGHRARARYPGLHLHDGHARLQQGL
jgi:hypothetical protein